MEEKNLLIKKLFLLALVIPFLFFSKVQAAGAASLYLSPAADSRYVGRTFPINVYVSSPDTAMNAAQGTVSFPIDKLEVISLSKSGSIFNLWVQEPSFSNRDGVINFGGVVVNPGFQGSSGKILTVTFRSKAVGNAKISFVSGSILANDGKGTNILYSFGSAAVALSEAPALATAPSTEIGGVPQPVISSSPSISKDNWYNFDSPKFAWDIPKGIDGVNYDISDRSDYQLPKESKGKISSAAYDLRNFADGQWYFLVNFKKGQDWGPTAVAVLQLDRTPPEPFEIVRKDDDPGNSQPVFEWQTTDKASGIAYEQAKIGDGDWFNPEILKKDSYVLPWQSLANLRTLLVRVYDKAGNFREESKEFSIISRNSWRYWLYWFIRFLGNWGWILVIAAAAAIVALYFLIYRLLKWRRNLKTELQEFKSELRRDLKQLEKQLEIEVEKGAEIDLRPSRLRKAKESLEKTTEHIERDIKEEVKKLDDFTEG